MAGMFDPHYVAEVLADILGREMGCEFTVALTKEAPEGSDADANDGGPVAMDKPRGRRTA